MFGKQPGLKQRRVRLHSDEALPQYDRYCFQKMQVFVAFQDPGTLGMFKKNIDRDYFPPNSRG